MQTSVRGNPVTNTHGLLNHSNMTGVHINMYFGSGHMHISGYIIIL